MPKGKRGKRESKRRAVLSEAGLSEVHLDAAGIDIGSREHWVAVPQGRDEEHVRSFPSVTSGLQALADWLLKCGVRTVAMESTGIYWVPLYELLQERGLEVLLVNARHVKNVPGRKDDHLDCQWLQKLHTFGLLHGSFRPDAEIAALRSYARHRDTLIAQAGSWVQRMQKALIQMNVQLSTVLSDIAGVTGMAIVREIVSGERDPSQLARHRDYRCKATQEEIVEALTGHYRTEHVFELRQAVECYDFLQRQVEQCDREIEALLIALGEDREVGEVDAPARKLQRSTNEPHFDVRARLYALTAGVDLTQLPGFGPYSALMLVSEVGTNMSRFKTEKHFVSWLTLAPHVHASGGKVLSSRTRPSANRAAHIFRLAAQSLGRSRTALGGFYRRLSSRIGKNKALTATARKLAILFYRLLKGDLEVRALDENHYTAKQHERAVRSLRRRAAELGMNVLDPSSGEVLV